MGQHCSCLFNQAGEHTFQFGQNVSGNANLNVITNKEYIKALTTSAQVPLNGTEEISNINEMIIMKKNILITRLISTWYGYTYRQKYKSHIKHMLVSSSQEFYGDFKTRHKNPSVAKAEQYPAFDKRGWNEMYSSNPNPQYSERLFETIVLMEYDDTNRDEDDRESLLNKAKSAYQGQVNIESQRHGFGAIVTKDGSKYTGYWRSNQFNGWGRYIDQSGTIYEGLFVNGILNGKGERITLENHIYQGDFVQGLREGTGTEETSELTYHGSYLKDKRCGFGEITLKSGDHYTGGFENNLFEGEGHYTWKKNNHQYIGQYHNNQMHGNGLYKWSDKEYYRGEYVYGIKEGNGEFQWPDGRKFTGSFKNGIPDGIGILLFPDGKKGEVQFVDGKINKKYKPKQPGAHGINVLASKNE